ncbi:hypothetical protein, partial [Synechococcus sp. UW179A]|uniref:hypothetical protein n=1 Tax=Synechococcus sp. UW179A TaxID=2575510 RepID=UPI001A7E058B
MKPNTLLQHTLIRAKSSVLPGSEGVVNHGMKLINKKTSRLKQFFGGLNTRFHTWRQNLFACFEGDLADFVAEKTNEALIFQFFINPLNIHALLESDQFK